MARPFRVGDMVDVTTDTGTVTCDVAGPLRNGLILLRNPDDTVFALPVTRVRRHNATPIPEMVGPGALPIACLCGHVDEHNVGPLAAGCPRRGCGCLRYRTVR